MAYQFNYEDPNVVLISHSSQHGSFHSCPRLFELRKVARVAQPWDDSRAASSGNAMHHAWYEYLRGNGKEAAAFRLMLDYPIRYQKSAMESRSLQACYSGLRNLLASPLLGAYNLAEIEHNGEVKKAIEVPFAIHLYDGSGEPYCLGNDGEKQVVYIGYIDCILYDVLTQRFKVCDLKTTTKWLADYGVMFQFDTQCMPYALVLERVLDQSIEQLDVLYAVVFIDMLEPTTTALNFTKDQQDLQEWARVLAMDLRDMRTYYQTQYWPRRSKACTGYSTCYYAQDICASRNPEYVAQRLAMDDASRAQENPDPRPPFEPWFTLELQIGGLS